MIVREISMGTNQTHLSFTPLAPTLVANILTVVLVYCFAMINQREKHGEEGRLTHLWLIVMVLSSTLYGLYTWGVYPFKKGRAVLINGTVEPCRRSRRSVILFGWNRAARHLGGSVPLAGNEASTAAHAYDRRLQRGLD
jgi:hypothetical protein